MKKGLKIAICVGVAVIVALAVFLGVYFGTRKKVSETSTDFSKALYNGQMTNGGMTVYYDGYLYFINGTKTNDGTKLKDNVRSAICRVRIDAEGNLDASTYEVVVDDLVGYDYGTLYFFGDYMYYTTPNTSKNYQDTVLYNQTKFMRYDLVNKKSYEIYTTKQNSGDEKITFSYYIVGNELDLVVYESTNQTITSVKVDKKPTVNYVIEEVLSCVLSENYGTCVTAGKEVDANSFVYYTKTYTDLDVVKSNKVYKTLPNKDESVKIYDEAGTVALLSIRQGLLFYSVSGLSNNLTGESTVFAQYISNKEGENVIDFGKATKISNLTFTNIIFYEDNPKYETDNNITAICFNDDNSQIVVLTRDGEVQEQITPVVISTLTDSKDLSFIGLTTLVEEEKQEESEDDGETEPAPDVKEETTPITHDVTYLLYVVSSKVYKIEIMRDGEISIQKDSILLTTSTVNAASNYLVPKIIGNYLYIFAKSVDDKGTDTEFIYLHRVDLTVEKSSTEKATFVGIKDENADKTEDEEE